MLTVREADTGIVAFHEAGVIAYGLVPGSDAILVLAAGGKHLNHVSLLDFSVTPWATIDHSVRPDPHIPFLCVADASTIYLISSNRQIQRLGINNKKGMLTCLFDYDRQHGLVGPFLPAPEMHILCYGPDQIVASVCTNLLMIRHGSEYGTSSLEWKDVDPLSILSRSADGTAAITCTTDHVIRVSVDGRVKIIGRKSPFVRGCVCDKEDTLVTGSRSTVGQPALIDLRDLKTGKLRFQVQWADTEIVGIDVDNSCKRVVSINSEGRVAVWKLP